MTRPQLSREQWLAFKREDYLQAACALMAERGPEVRVADITKRAGTARNTFYEVWPGANGEYGGREGCRRAVLQWIAAAFFDALAEGPEVARVWVEGHKDCVAVAVRYAHLIDQELASELEVLIADSLGVPLALVGGGRVALSHAVRTGHDLSAAITDLEALASAYTSDLPTVTCEQRRFMSRSVAYVYDRNAPVQLGDRVHVDNRLGRRDGTIRGIDFLVVNGRKKRRLQIHLDPIRA